MTQVEGDCIAGSSSLLADLLLSFESQVLQFSESSFLLAVAALIRRVLKFIGAPDHFGPTPLATSRAIVAIALTLVVYFIAFGNRNRRRRHRLATELQVAKAQLEFLQEKLRDVSQMSSSTTQHKEIRIFMDGAFDMMHYGHMNAFRLAKSLGTHLVVGVNSDDSITKCKGAPLMNDEERMAMVSACKFVDEVVPDCPYVMSSEYLAWVVDTYKIDYVVHGDDPCIVDGKDVYATAKETGKYRTIPRTDGVSTTDIVGRMLLLTKEHHLQRDGMEGGMLLGRQSKFLTTSRMLQLFSTNVKTPTSDLRVVYIDGAWDLFHPGHVAVLKAAKDRGDYLIVGVHRDEVVNKRRGMNLPLLNLHERVLSVLGCRYVDDVLIDAPYEITPEMISSLNIAEVVHGTEKDVYDVHEDRDLRYRHARSTKILSVVESSNTFRFENIIRRIKKNQETFQARFERKSQAESRHYEQKYSGGAPRS